MKRGLWMAVLVVLVPLLGFGAGFGVLQVMQAVRAEPAHRIGDFGAIVSDVGSAVVLVSTSTCPWCERTRQWLHGQGIPYRDCVVDRDPYAAQLLERLGSETVPLLVTAQHVVAGYEPGLFAEAVEVRPVHQTFAQMARCSEPKAPAEF